MTKAPFESSCHPILFDTNNTFREDNLSNLGGAGSVFLRRLPRELRWCPASQSLIPLIFEGPLTCATSIIGIVGTLVTTKGLRSTNSPRGKALTSTLSWLAVWDSVLLLAIIGYYGIKSTLELWGTEQANEASWILTQVTVFFHPIVSIAYTASSWLVVTVTVQRCLAVSNPLSHKFGVHGLGTRWNSVRSRSCILRHLLNPCLLLSLTSLLIHIPSFMELQSEDTWEAFFDYKQHHLLFVSMAKASNFLVMLNSATNFLSHSSSDRLQDGKRLIQKIRKKWSRDTKRVPCNRKKCYNLTKQDIMRLDVTFDSMWNYDIPSVVNCCPAASCLPLGAQLSMLWWDEYVPVEPSKDSNRVSPQRESIEGSCPIAQNDIFHHGKLLREMIRKIIDVALINGPMALSEALFADVGGPPRRLNHHWGPALAAAEIIKIAAGHDDAGLSKSCITAAQLIKMPKSDFPVDTSLCSKQS